MSQTYIERDDAKMMDKEIEKALKELEEELKWTHNDGVNLTKYDESLFNVIKQALTTKSKKEQAFDIIKEKGVNVGEFKKELDWNRFDYDFYMCYYRHFSIEELTKDEFISVIEVLK